MAVRSMTKLMVCGAVAVAIAGASSVTAFAAEMLSIAKDGVNLRSGPDTKYEVLFQLPEGYPLMVLSKKGPWIKVSDYEGDKGWVFNNLVTSKQHVIVKVKECNIRSGPGTGNDKIGTVMKDVILEKVDQKGEWVKVSHPQLTGWIHKNLIWP